MNAIHQNSVDNLFSKPKNDVCRSRATCGAAMAPCEIVLYRIKALLSCVLRLYRICLVAIKMFRV